MQYEEAARWLDATIKSHTEYRSWTLNLIASENVMSPDVARYYAIELGQWYGNYEGLEVRKRRYTGNKYLAELEERALHEACSLFKAGAADLRPLSGHIAGSSLIMGLCEPNDLVLELDRNAGGHRLAERLTEARLARLRIEPVPFDDREYQVDPEATAKAIQTSRPRLVILGSSNYLFPTPLTTIAAACQETDTTLVLDASHVAGLIAGGCFPQPFESNVDFMVTSTHKTLAGPQGGMLMSRSRELLRKVMPALYPGLITNHHLMRVPAMVALFAEWRTHGSLYARTIVDNASRLAGALDAVGIPVVTTGHGFTKSHTVLIRTQPLHRPAQELAGQLEACGIMTGSTQLPAVHGGEGLRVGVQEMTRLGLKAEHIQDLAELMHDAVFTQQPSRVAERARQFTEGLNEVHFCESYEH